LPQNLNIAKNRRIWARLLIDTPEGYFDVSDWLVSANISRGDIDMVGTGNSGVDDSVATLSFTLHNDGITESVTRTNFSPRDEQSFVNNWAGDYNPLLFPNVEVIFQVALFDYEELLQYDSGSWARTAISWEEANVAWEDADGTNLPQSNIIDIQPTETMWNTIFQGFLGDDIRVIQHEVTCECRDLAKGLMDTLIEEENNFPLSGNPRLSEYVIREILDTYGFEYIRFDPDTDTIPEPGASDSEFMIEEYEWESLQYETVWSAIQEIAFERGFYLGFMFDEDDGNYRLKYVYPDRLMDAESADYEINWETDIYNDEYNLSDKDIRNVCEVVYDRDEDDGTVRSAKVLDQESIDTYGRRFMRLDEEDTRFISNQTEAERLAQAAVNDLRELPAGQRVTLPFAPELDVLKGINIINPSLSDTKVFVGVESVNHQFRFDNNPSYQTEIVGSGVVSGGHKKWIDRDARSGVKKPFDLRDIKSNIIGNRVSIAAHNSSRRSKAGADYVCKGEDDQIIINQAIQDVVENEEGNGRIVLLEGTFIVSNQIAIDVDKINIVGQGDTVITTTVNDLDYIMFVKEGASEITVGGIDFDGADLAVRGLGVGHSLNCTVNNCTTRNCNSGFQLFSTGDAEAKNLVLTNCNTHDNTRGISMSGGTTGSNADIKINNNNIYNNNQGISFMGVLNILISSNNIYDNNLGITDAEVSPSVYPGFSQILSNTFHGNNTGILFYGAFSTTIEGNNFNDHADKHIRLNSGTEDIVLRNNICRQKSGNVDYAIRIAGDDTLISNNDLFNSASTAAILDNGTDTNFGAGNRVNNGNWTTSADG